MCAEGRDGEARRAAHSLPSPLVQEPRGWEPQAGQVEVAPEGQVHAAGWPGPHTCLCQARKADSKNQRPGSRGLRSVPRASRLLFLSLVFMEEGRQGEAAGAGGRAGAGKKEETSVLQEVGPPW